MNRKWIVAGVTAFIAVPTFAFVQQQGPSAADAQQAPEEESASQQVVEDSTAQPIAFPHDVHVEQYSMDCQYCHYSAERSVDAGMPPVGTCMGCHTIIPGSENPEEVETLREYAQQGEAIPWVRVYKVADHVRFPHMRHVNAGVGCQTCHGEVQEMGVVEEVAQPLEMGWCVSCHVENGADRDCTVCHY